MTVCCDGAEHCEGQQRPHLRARMHGRACIEGVAGAVVLAAVGTVKESQSVAGSTLWSLQLLACSIVLAPLEWSRGSRSLRR